MERNIISFDLDGTLADLNFEKAVWMEEIPRLYAEKNRLGLTAAKNAVYSAYEFIGNKNVNWYDIKFWLRELGLDSDYRKILKNSSNLINLYPDTVPALKRLGKKYKLAVISNATREFIDFKLKVEGLGKYFSATYSTISDFHCIKGDSKGYLEACRKMGIKPEELIHIGDDYEFDYLAAKRVGIDAYYLNRGGKRIVVGKTVKNLGEFAALML
ncbi:MAG: HAD family hydrolase [Candidatus Micrarchaeota archaeon]